MPTSSRTRGHSVVSSWLNGDDEVVENAGRYSPGASDVAVKDLEDLLQADVLISFTERAEIVPYLDAAARGGRHVEFGYAIGTGKTLFIVGPTENVFSCPVVHTVLRRVGAGHYRGP